MVVQAPQSLPPAPPTPTILSPPAPMDLSFYFGALIFTIALVAFFMCFGFISKYIFGAGQDDDNEEVSRNHDIEAGLTGSRTDDQPRSTTTTTTTHNQTQSHQVAAPKVKPRASSTTIAYFCGECVICLEEFKNGDRCLIPRRCGHMYHKACMNQWLSKNEHCPLCRGSLRAMRVINQNQEV